MSFIGKTVASNHCWWWTTGTVAKPFCTQVTTTRLNCGWRVIGIYSNSITSLERPCQVFCHRHAICFCIRRLFSHLLIRRLSSGLWRCGKKKAPFSAVKNHPNIQPRMLYYNASPPCETINIHKQTNLCVFTFWKHNWSMQTYLRNAISWLH